MSEDQEQAETRTLGQITRGFKREPNKDDIFHLGNDGVLRVFYSPYNPKAWQVIDAARLSPAHIKQFLDKGRFDQAREDRFRGVDGRGVPEKDLFDPPPHIKPKGPTEEQIRKHKLMIEERNREWKINPPKMAESCSLNLSNYNLDPIDDSKK
ncbi:hypothetical protein BT63DRAFT_422236 [Microthyrium microscopicum]|uniref:Uncharacterized protein n=1 Tax=Microthyrium microscopicum TaxID=703497 RepID=A0A6A6ULC9_9PEZI|nr:hypothetical protein BT63DRAFT_422236 [Microthyrium microscopicum]